MSEQLEFDLRQASGSLNDLAPHVVKAFWIYHSENPHVYGLLLRFAREAVRAGRDRYSIRAIYERARWHTTIETRGDDFKMNNNHSSCYSRLLMARHPELAGMFQTRTGDAR